MAWVITALAALATAWAVPVTSAQETVAISSLDLSKLEQDWGEPRADKSVQGGPLTIAGRRFERGIGTHANSILRIDVKGTAEAFNGWVGVDDEVGDRPGSVEFKVVGDGKILWTSGVIRAGQSAKSLSLDIRGVKLLVLLVTDAGNGIEHDHADWADVTILMTSGEPVTVAAPQEEPVILTPKPAREPRINGPSVFGVRPGAPFLYTIPATGDRPMTFTAISLPKGLQLDRQTGRITGKLERRGQFPVTLWAKNQFGMTEKKFRIISGDQIALTPPMGWNSWNCFGCDVSDEKVRAAADAMVASGLINHGWTYINIDDCWMGERGAAGNIQPNKKFPDMKALCDYVHSKGLKIGIYTSPGKMTCANQEGSFRHEEQDARRYAEWGIDYLKYDWCSYGKEAKDGSVEELKKPYLVMRAALNKVPRDIVFSLCQYGMGNVWEWGAMVGGNCWRTTGDITDTWGSMAGIGFNQADLAIFADPGHWNDPDMLVVGHVGWSADVRPTRLTPNEQYTHISLWCLLASPLLLGCDMTKLDPFTLNLLTNDEVLDVNQDALGKQATRVWQDAGLEIWAKDLEDGSKVAGLFNRGELHTDLTAKWVNLGITGKHVVRDLWRQQDLGTFNNEFTVNVPRHGVVLVRLSRASVR